MMENRHDPAYKAALAAWQADTLFALNEQTIAYAVRPLYVSDDTIAALAAEERDANARLPRPAKLSENDLYLYLDAYVILHEDDWDTLLGMIRAKSIVTEAALEDARKSGVGDVAEAGRVEVSGGEGSRNPEPGAD